MSKDPSTQSPMPGGLLQELAADGSVARTRVLPRRDLRLGRAKDNDVVIEDVATVSRQHAVLHWNGVTFELRDVGSREGTRHNDRLLEPDRRADLHHGDLLTFGKLKCRFLSLLATQEDSSRAERLLRLTRSLASLDPGEIVTRGLELLREVSGVQRALLVGAGSDPRLEPLLKPMTTPELKVSLSSIEEALRTGRKVSTFLTPDGGPLPTQSMVAFSLRRVWVCPVLGSGGQPIAAVYLDSVDAGDAFDQVVEEELESVAEHLGMALRNAALYAQVLDLNQTLEHRVAQRTRELKDTQTRLVAQDRLATLGRLVAAIAHELNNPAGAIASFASTLRGLLDPLLHLERELATTFPEPGQLVIARAILERSLVAAEGQPEDTEKRRQREATLVAWLRGHSVPSAEVLATRLARCGLGPDDLVEAEALLRSGGDPLSRLADRVHTFGHGVGTIERCAVNVARIVNGLKTYAHLDRSEMEWADLHRGIEATLSVLSTRIPSGITVETRFDRLEPLLHRPGELTQVWTNLVDNAVKSMGEEGRLVIETHNAGDKVRVCVSDTGPGVPAAIADHIFDLHVTTRGPGAGLGLGLPICRSIVEENHGGTISFTSQPGRTTFTVELPKKMPAPDTRGAGT